MTQTLTLLSILTLAAHGLRLGSPGLTLFWLLAGLLSLLPTSWKHCVLTGLLAYGTSNWLVVSQHLIEHRLLLAEPWLRLCLIMTAVTLLSLTATILQFRRTMVRRDTTSIAQGFSFLLTTAGLTLAREQSNLTILLTDRFFVDSGPVAIFFLGCYGAWLTGRMLATRHTARLRRLLWAGFSLVFFLQLLLGLAGFPQFLMTGALHLPVPALIAAGPLFRGEGLFMIILFTATVILVGPAWCSYLCYIGAWDNWNACSRKKGAPLPKWAFPARLAITILVLLSAYLLGRSGVTVIVAAGLAGIFGLLGVALMLTVTRRSGTMSHCTVFCPMGLLANVFGKVSPWRIRLASDCNRCGACTTACRYSALTAADLARGRPGLTCTLCGDCLASCRQGHLGYAFPGLTPATARVAFVTLIVSLHALFLGVARL